jgi:hypothetical protein
MLLPTALLSVLHSSYSNTLKKIATYNYHLILPILKSSVSFQGLHLHCPYISLFIKLAV